MKCLMTHVKWSDGGYHLFAQTVQTHRTNACKWRRSSSECVKLNLLISEKRSFSGGGVDDTAGLVWWACHSHWVLPALPWCPSWCCTQQTGATFHACSTRCSLTVFSCSYSRFYVSERQNGITVYTPFEHIIYNFKLRLLVLTLKKN